MSPAEGGSEPSAPSHFRSVDCEQANKISLPLSKQIKVCWTLTPDIHLCIHDCVIVQVLKKYKSTFRLYQQFIFILFIY